MNESIVAKSSLSFSAPKIKEGAEDWRVKMVEEAVDNACYKASTTGSMTEKEFREAAIDAISGQFDMPGFDKVVEVALLVGKLVNAYEATKGGKK